MAAGSGKSFGIGWLQDQLRARFDIRGPIGEPYDVEPKVQVGMEARPSLPWEYGNARWFPVWGEEQVAAGGAGTFASISISCAAGQRALVLTSLWVNTNSTLVGVYVNQPFVAGNKGFALRDGRFLAAGSWLTPVPEASLIAQNIAVALPAATGRVWSGFASAAPVGPVQVLDDFLILNPGQTVVVFEEAGNAAIFVSAAGLLVPVGDLA